jgi:hypothetical protein
MIEYLHPSYGGVPQLKYISLDLGGQDFTKLLSSPKVLIANGGKTIVPINVTVKYFFNGAIMLTPLLIGFETTLGWDVNTCAWGMTNLLVTNNTGTFSQSYLYSAGVLFNIDPVADLLLWQSSDNAALAFSTFTVNILYLEVDNL